MHATLLVSNPIIAGEGSNEAKVTWKNPVFNDNEDGVLE